MIIIGVSAKKQGGKSNVVSVLQTRKVLPASTQVVRFADFLKKIVLGCFVPVEWGWTVEDLDVDENKNTVTPCGLTVRKLLQIVGTDWFRHTYSECWINAYKAKLATLDCAYVLTPDVRFPNELETIQERGGVVIRMLRAPFGDEDQHESETALDGVEYDTLHVFDDSPVGHRVLKFDYICDNRSMTLDEVKMWVKGIFLPDFRRRKGL